MGLSMAVSNVEKILLNQDAKSADDQIKQERNHQQGTLADALLRGELTQEVKELRWRMYKILKNSQRMVFTPHSSDGKLAKNKTNEKNGNFNLDKTDGYELELLLDNSEITASIADALNKTLDADGVISGMEYFARTKSEKPIFIMRDFIPKFDLEAYTIKLAVRKINETEKLLEFYVSKYPDEYNVNSIYFLKEIKKAMAYGPRNINLLEIKEVGFFSNNTHGSDDFLVYGYEIISFEKIVEFDGHYVIKYKAKVLVNAEDMMAEFKEEELDKKYESRQVRKK